MKNIDNIKDQRFFNRLAIISFTILNIIVMGVFLNKNLESSDLTNESSFFNEDPKEYTDYYMSSISYVKEKSTPSVNKAEKIDNTVIKKQIIKKVTQITKVVKIVPVKKIVVKKRKIELIEMTSIPALTVSSSEMNHDNYLVSDSFVKQNEIISEAIEVIDSIEFTENDTIIKDSTYYVMETNTVTKNEEPVKIETTITNPNTKIVPIRWNDKKIWTKADTTKKIVSNKKVFSQYKPDTNKIDMYPKGTWSLYKNENNENATNQTESPRETTYGGYKILLPSAPNEEVPNNLDDNGYETVKQTQQMKETIYWPPPIFDKWHWHDNHSFFLLYEEFRE